MNCRINYEIKNDFENFENKKKTFLLFGYFKNLKLANKLVHSASGNGKHAAYACLVFFYI